MEELARKRILLIDDDDDQLYLTKTMLEETRADFEIAIARSGEEGLELIEREKFDCVISDFEMKPGMNGVDLLRTLSDRQVNVPFIIVTAKESGPFKYDALREGAADFIHKATGARYISGIANSIEQAIRSHQVPLEEFVQEPETPIGKPVGGQMYRESFHLAPYLGILLNADGLTISELNLRAQETFGKTSADCRGTALAMLVTPGDRQKLRHLIFSILSGECVQETINFAGGAGKTNSFIVSGSTMRQEGSLIGVILYAL